MSHLKVVVRVRPLSQRELNSHTIPVVEVQGQNAVAVTNLKVPEQNAGDSRDRIRSFTFDYCFCPDSSQDEVFQAVGEEVENAFKRRYHSCVFAYGQSSSGKTHTMMGVPGDPGLTPRLCQNIFKYLQGSVNDGDSPKTSAMISYIEIYNEKVRDLLAADGGGHADPRGSTLRVREHPKKGPYVQGLTQRTARDPDTLLRWLAEGNAGRRVSATLTNPHSSRSHSVFTVTSADGVQLHLVDLAGSERAGSRFHSISTLKEGANINKSLVALGNVIFTLADQSSKNLKSPRKRFVPYRDSVLTWLLKDTLGGNSKTIMIATVSPSNACYNETVNTLRFGQRAKKIISHPVVNEDPKERTIRELRAEIARLRQLLAVHQAPDANEPDLFRALEDQAKSPSIPLEKDPAENSEENRTEQRYQPNTAEHPFVGSPLTSKCAVVTQSNTKKDGEQLCLKREQLVPVMSVRSAVDPSKKQVPKIRRTASVEHEMNPKPARSRLFGSEETISNPSKEQKSKRLSQPSITPKKLTDKPPLAARSLLKKDTSKKAEAGIVTEERGPKKAEPARKPSLKPRSQIVAAVTSRLYGKTKKKEIGTETEEVKPTAEEVPKELTICSNARMRLRELTHQALKIHKRRSVDTQTDLFPVLRVKEISTDSDDLKVALVEVRDAETGTLQIETKDVEIACLIENFDDHQSYKHSFVITRSCGTQSTEKYETSKPREPPQGSGISFTKYLQGSREPTLQIVNPCTANPIYTSAVNINVSHNYINRGRLNDAVSDDSLEEHERPGNVCFPTPDIISNHNSLEHGNAAAEAAPRSQELKQGRSEVCAEPFATSEAFAKTEPPLLCTANFSFSTKRFDRLKSIGIPEVCAPQVCITGPRGERCGPLWRTTPQPETARVKSVEKGLWCLATVYRPVVLKSIMKHQECSELEDSVLYADSHLEEPSKDAFSDLPDSLTLHEANKKVHFSPTKNERIFEAMSKFMEEATNLMTNLSKAATKLQAEQSYDLEVTVNGVRNLASTESSRDFTAQTCVLEEASSQTCPKKGSDASSNTELPFQIPINKYERLVKESCDKLERCINKAKNQQTSCNRRVEEESLHRFPQPFSTWNAGGVDDSSLDSNPTYSDYGSLPRQRRGRLPSCSPSAYLRQLTSMRRHIVESSRDDLIGQAKINF